MQETTTPLGNRFLSQLPADLGEGFEFREAPWIVMLMTAGLVITAGIMFMLGLEAITRDHWLASALLCSGAGLTIFMAFHVRAHESSKFICTRDGLFFPEFRRFSKNGAGCLHVPWHNVLDYQVQRLLDETSSHGLVMALLAGDEEGRFLQHRSTFRLPASAWGNRQSTLRICFSSILPGPIDVLFQLRKFDTVRRYQVSPHQFQVDPSVAPKLSV